MKYNGKYLDTFEAAMGQLFEFNQNECPKNLDCIGLRCFGFALGGDIAEWFRPLISIQTAVHCISSVLGISLNCRKIKKIEDVNFKRRGAVIGAVKSGIAVTEIKNYYYNGEGHYIFLAEGKNEKYYVFDPQGIPGITVTREEINAILQEKQVFAIFPAADVRIRKKPDKKELVISGMEYHWAVKQEEKEMMEEAFSLYKKGSGNKIALQYGIMNLLLQLDKTFFLVNSIRSMPDIKLKEYMGYKQELYCLGEREKVAEIPEVYGKIWRILENGV